MRALTTRTATTMSSNILINEQMEYDVENETNLYRSRYVSLFSNYYVYEY